MVVQANDRGQRPQVGTQRCPKLLCAHGCKQRAGAGIGPPVVCPWQGLHGLVQKAIKPSGGGNCRDLARMRGAGPDGKCHGKGQRGGFVSDIGALAHVVKNNSQRGVWQGLRQICQLCQMLWKLNSIVYQMIE